MKEIVNIDAMNEIYVLPFWKGIRLTYVYAIFLTVFNAKHQLHAKGQDAVGSPTALATPLLAECGRGPLKITPHAHMHACMHTYIEFSDITYL